MRHVLDVGVSAGSRLRRRVARRLPAGVLAVATLLGVAAGVQAQTLLPQGTVGEPYNSGPLPGLAPGATGQCQLVAFPSALPAGLTVTTADSVCRVTGTPTAQTLQPVVFTVQTFNGATVTAQLQYSITINLTGSVLIATPNQLAFGAPRGGTPPTQTVRVTTSSTAAVSFTIQAVATWLQVPSGVQIVGPGGEFAVSVNVNTAGLPVGQLLTTTLTLTPVTGANRTPRVIPVNLVITETGGAVLTAVPPQDTLTVNAGVTDVTERTITVTNTGATVNVTAITATQPWLTVTPVNPAQTLPLSLPPGGTLPLLVRVNPVGLEAGAYPANIEIRSGDAALLAIPFSLRVEGVLLTTSTASLTLRVQENGTTSGTFNVGQGGTGTATPLVVTTTTENNLPWLTATAGANPTVPAIVTVTANAAGLTPGTYRGTVRVAAVAPVAAIPRVVLVEFTVVSLDGITVSPSVVSFRYQRGTTAPGPRQVVVASPQGAIPYAAVASAPWIVVTPPSGGFNTAAGPLSISLNPAFIPGTGPLSGTVTLNFQQAGISPRIITVNAAVTDTAPALNAEPGSLLISSPVGGGVITNNVTVTAGAAPVIYRVESSQSWLVATPTSGTIPANSTATLSVTTNPTGLAAGYYTGTLSIVSGTDVLPVTVVLAVGVNTGQSRYISRLVDGGGWRTVVTMVNTSTQPQNFRLRFVNAATRQPLALAFEGVAANSELTGTLPPGGSRTFLSVAPATTPLVTGWGELTADASVDGQLIFRAVRASLGQADQEASVPFTPAGLRDFVVPFDNSQETAGNTERFFTTAFAVTNPSATQPLDLRAQVSDENGFILFDGLSAAPVATLPPQGHQAFELTSLLPTTAGRRGTIRFTANGDVAALGLRFTAAGAFTSFPPSPVAATSLGVGFAQYFPQIAEGGAAWRTTLLLFARDREGSSTPYVARALTGVGQPFTLPLDNGSTLSTISRTVQARGLEVLRTTGATPNVTSGYVEVQTTDRPIGGIAVYRATAVPGTNTIDQEAAVPASQALRRFVLPFDNAGDSGQPSVTSMAIVNLSALPTTVRIAVRDEAGTVVETAALTMQGREHRAFELATVLQTPAVRTGRGSVEFTSEQGDVAAVGLRFRAGSFTSLPVIAR